MGAGGGTSAADGYAYLTQTLGLSAAAMDRGPEDETSLSPHRFAA